MHRVLVLAALLPLTAAADVIIHQSGRLLDAEEKPVQSATVKIAFFDAKAFGSELWSETYGITGDANGVFSIALGDADGTGKKALPDTVFAGGTVYMELTVGSAALSPRLAVGSMPRASIANSAKKADSAETAKKADDADKLGGIVAADYAKKSDLAGLSQYALAADVYKKAEVDTAIAAQGTASTTALNAAKAALQGSIDTTQTTLQASIDSTKTTLQASIDTKAAKTDLAVYAKTADVPAKGDSYTKAEDDARFAPKAGAVPAGVTVVGTPETKAALEAAGFVAAGATAQQLVQLPNATHATSHNNQAPVIGTKMYVVGGHGEAANGCQAKSDVSVYDYAKRTWTQKQGLVPSRYGHSTFGYNGKVYVFGGYTDCSPSGGKPTVQVYDPATDGWSGLGTMPLNNNHHASCAAQVGSKVYLVGGYSHATSADTATTDIYDVASNQWTVGASMPYAADWIMGTASGGKIFCGGAWGPGNNQWWMYDPASNQWTRKANLLTGNGLYNAAEVNGTIHLVTGHNGSTILAEHYMYDVATDKWTQDQGWPMNYYLPTIGQIPGGFISVGGWNGATRAAFQWMDPITFYRKQ